MSDIDRNSELYKDFSKEYWEKFVGSIEPTSVLHDSVIYKIGVEYTGDIADPIQLYAIDPLTGIKRVIPIDRDYPPYMRDTLDYKVAKAMIGAITTSTYKLTGVVPVPRKERL